MSTKVGSRQQYQRLRNPASTLSPKLRRERGFLFEKIIHTVLENESLQPRTSYKAQGEQIDGSFYFQNKIFLLEAKWHSKSLPASTIYQFKGKVDGKLTGTIGIFISMSGYSTDAIDALISGKVLNVILFDSEDFDSVFEDSIGFAGVLKSKLRFAAEEGNVFFPFKSRKVNARTTSLDRTDNSGKDTIIVSQEQKKEIRGKIVVICQSKADRELISLIVQRILRENNLQTEVNVIDTIGKLNMTRVAESLKSLANSKTQIVLIADGNNDPEGITEFFQKNLSFKDLTIVVPDQTVSDWLPSELYTFVNDINIESETDESLKAKLNPYINKIDLNKLISNNKSFTTFYNSIILDTSSEITQNVIFSDKPGAIPVKGISFTTPPKTPEQEIAAWVALFSKYNNTVPPKEVLWDWYKNRHSLKIPENQRVMVAEFCILSAEVPPFYWLKGCNIQFIKEMIRHSVEHKTSALQIEPIQKVASFMGRKFYNSISKNLSKSDKSLQFKGKYPSKHPKIAFTTKSIRAQKESELECELTMIAEKFLNRKNEKDVNFNQLKWKARNIDCHLYAQDKYS